MSSLNIAAPSAFSGEAARLFAIRQAIGPQRLEQSALARTLAPLLIALDWFGAPRRLAAALPDEHTALDVPALRSTLTQLGYRVERRPAERSEPAALTPGSLRISGGQAHVYLGWHEAQHWWHDGIRASADAPDGQADCVLHISADPAWVLVDAPQNGWFRKLIFRAHKEIGGILGVSLVVNLLTLLVSLFTMFVYNTVIPAGSANGLPGITAGVVLAILAGGGLRLARASLLARLTAWAGLHISNAAMRKTLSLPLDVSARLGVENNLSRLRSIEAARQWFSGGSGLSADYPFVLIFLLVIALLGGWIVFVPITALLLFWLCAYPLANLMHQRSVEAGRRSRQLADTTGMLSRQLRSLRGVSSNALWQRHLGPLIVHCVRANEAQARANGLSQSVGQALGMLTVLATLGVGIVLVLDGVMNTGGLIATMMLIWRVTTPAQQLFASQVRLRQMGDSVQQLDRLMQSAGEAMNPKLDSVLGALEARLNVEGLFYRYSPDRDAAISGVSFSVEPGQLLAVVGPNGAGKSTLIELLSGARQPQSGRVMIGGRDIRQFDPADYRAWHGYLPQRVPALPVTVREAMRLRHTLASDAELFAALERVAGAAWWRLLGADSAESALALNIPHGQEDAAARRGRWIIRMAASLLGEPPLILLDNPLSDSDPVLDACLLQTLASLKGRRTVVLVTHRAELIEHADLIAVLNNGSLAHFGPVAAKPADAPTQS